jgi:bla regulator protein blaR1
VCVILLLGMTLAGGGAGAAGLPRPIATSAESPAVRPQFDVASVREDPPSALRHVIQSPIGNRFHTTTASVRLLIQYAHGVQTFEILGGPDWMNTIGYDVDAREAGNPTGGEMRLMLQSLLEDRFRLKFHRGTKDVSVIG